jgi:hypothetical protein
MVGIKKTPTTERPAPPPSQRPPGRYEYIGILKTYHGTIGDEFWLKLQSKEAKREEKRKARKARWGF